MNLKNPAFNPFIAGARDVVSCIRTGASSLSSGRDGLKALEIILAIYRSAQENGKRIKIKAASKIVRGRERRF